MNSIPRKRMMLNVAAGLCCVGVGVGASVVAPSRLLAPFLPAARSIAASAPHAATASLAPNATNAEATRATSLNFYPPAPIPNVAVPEARMTAKPDELSTQSIPGSAISAIASLAPGAGASAAGPPIVLAYAAPDAGAELRPELIPSPIQPPAIVAPSGLREAIAAYRAGDLAAGDALRESIDDPIGRLAIDWAAVRLQPQIAGLPRLKRFLATHADWPSALALRRRAEELVWADKKSPDEVLKFFAARAPETPLGKLALARADLARGKIDEAGSLARDVWRNADIQSTLETIALREFGDYLTWADHKYRSDRLFYKGNASASMRAAGLAGPDVLAIAKARENASDKLIAALPAEHRNDASVLFARIQKLRTDNKPMEAARLMLTAPRDPAALVNPDEWWVERRLIARKLLDLGEPKLAYLIAANHSAQARDLRIEAEFHAGWIALRFLADPAKADAHFAKAETFAETPISIARVAYWRGRAAEAREDAAQAARHFEDAAKQPTTFYGQLALAKLGRDTLALREPAAAAEGDQRHEAVRVVEALEAIDARDLAAPLAIDMARFGGDESQLAALGEALANARDAKLALTIGKLASQRGFRLDQFAFPTFGVPEYAPIPGSATAPLVYAIARQESAFDAHALSSAGARGLMQMMPATARRTAQHKGIAYDEARLLNDPAFNAMLGAAHLGELNGEHRGSLILTFAAYNAGGRRVKEWIAAHGDPRDANIDPVDWIELIPIAETRNYVQRIAENLEVYRARLGGAPKLAIEATLRDGEAKK